MPDKDEPKVNDKAIADKVQETTDTQLDQGFRGVEVDSTPNENYTVAGVTSGKPTPETDPEAAEAVGSRKFIGGVSEPA